MARENRGLSQPYKLLGMFGRPVIRNKGPLVIVAMLPEVFETALRYHRAGRRVEAEQLCRQILAADPANSDAWHLLGILAQQAGKHEIALQCLAHCVTNNPLDAEAYNNL